MIFSSTPTRTNGAHNGDSTGESVAVHVNSCNCRCVTTRPNIYVSYSTHLYVYIYIVSAADRHELCTHRRVSSRLFSVWVGSSLHVVQTTKTIHVALFQLYVVERNSDINMIRVVGIALLLASILLDASQGNTFTHYAFSPKIGVWQADENHHTVVDLATSAVDTECADYCTHRGSLFRYVDI
jgi:hypothetical protein